MKLLYGTTNRAKLDAMKKALAGLPIELIGLGDLSGPLPKIEEDGATPLENAQRKARAYYEAFGIPVFPATAGCILMRSSRRSSRGFMCAASTAGSLTMKR